MYDECCVKQSEPCCEQPQGSSLLKSDPTIRDIRIEEVSNGFFVRVGCKTFVFTDVDMLLYYLSAYIRDPQMVEQVYNEGKLFDGGKR
jgi:hypothetical protein